MTIDGSTFLDRIEKIKAMYDNVGNDDNELLTSEKEKEEAAKESKYIKKSIIHLKWNEEKTFGIQQNEICEL